MRKRTGGPGRLRKQAAHLPSIDAARRTPVAHREARARLESAMSAIRAFQISNGLGAGNIGDDLMAWAFWDQIPREVALEVGVFPESGRLREPYPRRHRYREVDWAGNENGDARDMPGLLVGDTPVTDTEGLHWPMQFLASRLQHFHDAGQPVDAVGVGVDRRLGADARVLFQKHFLPIRSWTVRSPDCREALIAFGVPESRIRVGADWAWLHRPRPELRDWAHAYWRRLQIDPESPLIAVNVVNMQWRDRAEGKRALAAALDWASARLDLQVAFFCNDCRAGEFFDRAAALETMAFMSEPAALVPNEYFSPAEAVALLSCATVTLGQRYHFLVESVLAGCVPIGSVRGEKMRRLASELSIGIAGTVEGLDKDEAAGAIQQAVERRGDLLHALREAQAGLSRRAMENLAFVRTSPPYAGAAW